jgi:hypothetical protein
MLTSFCVPVRPRDSTASVRLIYVVKLCDLLKQCNLDVADTHEIKLCFGRGSGTGKYESVLAIARDAMGQLFDTIVKLKRWHPRRETVPVRIFTCALLATMRLWPSALLGIAPVGGNLPFGGHCLSWRFGAARILQPRSFFQFTFDNTIRAGALSTRETFAIFHQLSKCFVPSQFKWVEKLFEPLKARGRSSNRLCLYNRLVELMLTK